LGFRYWGSWTWPDGDETFILCRSAALEGAVKRCYFSFVVFHRKVQRNTGVLRGKTDIVCHDVPTTDRIEIANDLADIASGHGIEMLSCCGDYLVGCRIKKAHCTDAELLYRLYPDKIGRLAEVPMRDGCGCCECTDIGAYDTCPHGCVYCYANTNAQTVLRSHERHDLGSDILGGRGSSSGHGEHGNNRDLTLALFSESGDRGTKPVCNEVVPKE